MRTLLTSVVFLLTTLFPTVTSAAKANYAYVADFYGSNVSVIDTSSNNVVANIPLNFQWGVAINATRTMACVTDYYQGVVSLISTKTNTVTGTITVGSGPLGVVFAPKGANA